MKVYPVLFLVAALFVPAMVYAVSGTAFSLPPGINATSTAFVNLTDTITVSSATQFASMVVYTFNYQASSQINLMLPSYANDIGLFLNGQPYPFSMVAQTSCSAASNQTCIEIAISNVAPSETFTLSYSFSNTYIPGSTVFNTTFLFIPFAPTQLRVAMVLPKGTFLPANQYYQPRPATFSSNGQNIEVLWAFYQNTAGVPLPFTVSYSGNFQQQTTKTPLVSYIIASILIIGIALALIILAKYKGAIGHGSKPIRKRISPFAKILNDDEKRIYGILKSDTFTPQRSIVQMTGFSKAKISKILAKLNRFKLVRIKFEGKTNKVKKI
jgi:uncharacterized membrane protein